MDAQNSSTLEDLSSKLDEILGGSVPTAAEILGLLDSTLAKNPIRPSEFSPKFASLAVRLRDSGDISGCLDILHRTIDLYPICRKTNLEIIVIHTLVRPDVSSAIKTAQNIPSCLHADPHIRLLIAQCHRMSGDLRNCIQWMHDVNFISVQHIPSFANLWRDVFIDIVNDFISTTIKLDRITGPTENSAHLTSSVALLSKYLLSFENSVDGFYECVRLMTFERPGVLHMNLHLISMALSRLPLTISNEILSVIFAFLVSTRQYKLASRFALFADLPSRPTPLFIKFSLLAQYELSEIISNQDLTAFVVSGGDVVADLKSTDAHLEYLELTARELRSATDKPDRFKAFSLMPPTTYGKVGVERHLFVGVFGQIRFADLTLEKLWDFAKRDFGQFDIFSKTSVGVSTWNTSGLRELSMGDGYGFALQRLPNDMHAIVNLTKPRNVADLHKDIPNVIDRLLGDNATQDEVSGEKLYRYFGIDVYARIDQEQGAMASLDEKIEKLIGANIAIRNQARMWSRISAMRSAIEDAERNTGTPVTHALLFRPDLTNLNGSVAKRVAQTVATGHRNWMLVDHDHHAAYIHGVGDRFVAVDRTALQRLLDGFSLFSAVVDDVGVDRAYVKRLRSHAFLETIMFEHNTRIISVPQSEFGFSIHRGKYAMSDLKSEIILDHGHTQNAQIKSLLEAFVRL